MTDDFNSEIDALLAEVKDESDSGISELEPAGDRKFDMNAFTLSKKSVFNQFRNISVPSCIPVLTNFDVVESLNFTSLSLFTNSVNCLGNVKIKFRILEYNSGNNRLHNVTISTTIKTNDTKIPTPREIFSAFSRFFMYLSKAGTRYLSIFLTIGFNRYAITQPYTTGFKTPKTVRKPSERFVSLNNTK